MPDDLDLWIVLSENVQSNKPSQAYCQQYAAQHNVDPERVLLDWSDSDVAIPIQDPPGTYTIPVNAMGTTYQKIDPYYAITWICAGSGAPCQSHNDCSTGDQCGIVSSFSPWHAVLDGRNFQYIWSSFYDDTKWAGDYVNQLTQ